MPRPSDTPRVDALLEQQDWLQEMARKLQRDPEQARDLAQDVLLVALDRGPNLQGAELRRWLWTVLRNRHFQVLRSAKHRIDREQRSARPEYEEDGDFLLDETSVEDRILSLLDELPKDERDVLVARYLRNRSLAEVARQDGVSRTTLQSRLKRGLSRLSRKADRRWGTGASVLAFLAGLLALRRSDRTATLRIVAACGAGMGAVALLVVGLTSAPTDSTSTDVARRVDDATPRPGLLEADRLERDDVRTDDRSTPVTDQATDPERLDLEILGPPPASLAPLQLQASCVDAAGRRHPSKRGRTRLVFEDLPSGTTNLLVTTREGLPRQLTVELTPDDAVRDIASGRLVQQVTIQAHAPRSLEIEVVLAGARRTDAFALEDIPFEVRHSTEPVQLGDLLPWSVSVSPLSPRWNPSTKRQFRLHRFNVYPFSIDPNADGWIHLTVEDHVMASAPLVLGADRVRLTLSLERLAALFHVVDVDVGGQDADVVESMRWMTEWADPGVERPEPEPVPAPADGFRRWRGFAPVPHLLVARGSSGPIGRLVVPRGSGVLRVEPPDADRPPVAARVLRGGEPVPNVNVVVTVPCPELDRPARFRFKTNDLGTVSLPALDGRASVRALHLRNDEDSGEHLLPLDGLGASPVVLELRPAVWRVLEIPEECDPSHVRITGSDPRLGIDAEHGFGHPIVSLPPGAYHLQTRDRSSGKPASYRFEVSADDRRICDFERVLGG